MDLDRFELLLVVLGDEGRRQQECEFSDGVKDRRFQWLLTHPAKASRLFSDLAHSQITRRRLMDILANEGRDFDDWEVPF